MGEMINLGKFKMVRGSENSLRNSEVKEELSKLGAGWRVCSFKELDYIHSIWSELGIKGLVDFKEGDLDNLYRISNSDNTAFYVDADGLLQPFYIPYEENTEDLLLDYVFVKDI